MEVSIAYFIPKIPVPRVPKMPRVPKSSQKCPECPKVPKSAPSALKCPKVSRASKSVQNCQKFPELRNLTKFYHQFFLGHPVCLFFVFSSFGFRSPCAYTFDSQLLSQSFHIFFLLIIFLSFFLQQKLAIINRYH